MPKALIVVTNHDEYPTREDTTGLWFGELNHFYHPLKEAGFEIDFVSPKGGAIPIDPRSTGFLFMGKQEKAYMNDEDFMQRLNNSLKPEDITPQDYDVIYYTGGHGTMWDFPENEQLQEISRTIYEKGGIVSAVCHGVGGLLNITLSDGSNLIDGKSITGYSNFEEVLAGLKNAVPFLLEDELKARGGTYAKAMLPFMPYVRDEARVITGQNPQSTRAVAKRVLEVMRSS